MRPRKDLELSARRLQTIISGNDDNQIFTPFERVVLTTSGHLQRLISAYFNAPVIVDILRNEAKESLNENLKIFYRNVILSIEEPSFHAKNAFGYALSQVMISSQEYLEFFESVNPGLGQFFQHFCLYPSFELLRIGRGIPGEWSSCDKPDHVVAQFEDCKWPWENAVPVNYTFQLTDMLTDWNSNSFWRLYKLECPGIQCHILEILRSDIPNMAANQPTHNYINSASK